MLFSQPTPTFAPSRLCVTAAQTTHPHLSDSPACQPCSISTRRSRLGQLARQGTLALLATTALALGLPGQAEAAGFISIQGKTVNVRQQPTTQSKALWELTRGYPLQVQQRKGQWLKVRDYEASLGWVYAPLTGKTPHRVVKAPVANLRAGPGQGHRVIGKLEQHEVVRTLGQQANWARVQRDNGQKGWVAKSLTWGW